MPTEFKPSSGLRRLTLEDPEPEERYRSSVYLQHSRQPKGEDIPTQSHSGGREALQLSIGEEEQVLRERRHHLEVPSWYPRGEGVLQGSFVEHTSSPYLPQSARCSTQSTLHLHRGTSSGPNRTRSFVGLEPVNSYTLLLPPLPSSTSTLIPETPVEGIDSAGPVSFRDIGVPEAEGRLRRAHNLASSVSLTMSGLPEPAAGKRPPQSYNLLVQLAIWESPERRLTLQEIYGSISNRFEYYREMSEERKRRWQVRSRYF